MSRFFTQGDSSSESSSGDEESLYGGDDIEDKPSEGSDDGSDSGDTDEETSSSDGGDRTGVNKFLRDQESSEESEDEEKVTIVRSAKDKRLEELEGVVKLIDNAKKIGDWSSISTGEHDTLGTALRVWYH